jgi:hypothetical protein
VRLLSYLRTLSKIVEAPDLGPRSRRGIWLPRFGSPPQTVLSQFTIRTRLGAAALTARMVAYISAKRAGRDVQFEELWTDDLIGLDLNL